MARSVKAQVYSTANRPRYSGGEEEERGEVAHRRFWNPQYAKIAPMERIASAGQAIVERARARVLASMHKRIIARGGWWRACVYMYARAWTCAWTRHIRCANIKEFPPRVYTPIKENSSLTTPRTSQRGSYLKIHPRAR